ncbi:MAG: lytic transglycosylase domain-containing protein [Treponema sp.]|nr:lytic transglycosylase domain-containing protein [Treponema sp.]
MNKIKVFFLSYAILSSLSLFSQELKHKKNDYTFLGSEKPSVITLKKKYTTTHYTWLCDILNDAEFLRIYVRRELEKRNMPSYIEYLPLVESNYNPNAKSSSGALGMWQFMLNSVKPFLTCNEYIDERKDPWYSTQAALSKLQDNYKMFKDWPLAITAYNCGAGSLSRTLKKSEKKDFWYLVENNLLSSQASSYFQKLLAIADICENQEFYGFYFPTARNYLGKTKDYPTDDFDYITVTTSVNLKDLAYEMRLDEQTLLNLNLSLIKGVTPPHTKYKIRLPAKMKKTAEYALENLN